MVTIFRAVVIRFQNADLAYWCLFSCHPVGHKVCYCSPTCWQIVRSDRYLVSGRTELQRCYKLLFCRATWHAYSLRPGGEHRKIKTPESVLNSSPGEVVSCILENKHDRRTAPSPRLLVWNRRLQKQRPQHR
jgi:hypothetical protein